MNSKKSQPAAIYEKLQVSLENQLDLHRFSYHEKCIHLSTMHFVLGMIKTFTDQWVRQKKNQQTMECDQRFVRRMGARRRGS